VPQVHQVEIEGEDLRLAVVLFELHRHERFLDLAPPRALAGEVQAAGELHGDRRGSLHHPSGLHVGHRGAQHAHCVDPAVAEEVAVLRGEHGLLHDRRDFRLLEHHPPLAGEGRIDAAIARDELRHQARRIADQGLDPGDVDGRGHRHASQCADDHGDDERDDPAQYPAWAAWAPRSSRRSRGAGTGGGLGGGQRIVSHPAIIGLPL